MTRVPGKTCRGKSARRADAKKGSWLDGPAVTLHATDGAPLIEPQEVLAHVAGLRSVVAVASPTRGVWWGAHACVVAKLPAPPRWEVSAAKWAQCQVRAGQVGTWSSAI